MELKSGQLALGSRPRLLLASIVGLALILGHLSSDSSVQASVLYKRQAYAAVAADESDYDYDGVSRSVDVSAAADDEDGSRAAAGTAAAAAAEGIGSGDGDVGGTGAIDDGAIGSTRAAPGAGPAGVLDSLNELNDTKNTNEKQQQQQHSAPDGQEGGSATNGQAATGSRSADAAAGSRGADAEAVAADGAGDERAAAVGGDADADADDEEVTMLLDDGDSRQGFGSSEPEIEMKVASQKIGAKLIQEGVGIAKKGSGEILKLTKEPQNEQVDTDAEVSGWMNITATNSEIKRAVVKVRKQVEEHGIGAGGLKNKENALKVLERLEADNNIQIDQTNAHYFNVVYDVLEAVRKEIRADRKTKKPVKKPATTAMPTTVGVKFSFNVTYADHLLDVKRAIQEALKTALTNPLQFWSLFTGEIRAVVQKLWTAGVNMLSWSFSSKEEMYRHESLIETAYKIILDYLRRMNIRFVEEHPLNPASPSTVKPNPAKFHPNNTYVSWVGEIHQWMSLTENLHFDLSILTQKERAALERLKDKQTGKLKMPEFDSEREMIDFQVIINSIRKKMDEFNQKHVEPLKIKIAGQIKELIKMVAVLRKEHISISGLSPKENDLLNTVTGKGSMNVTLPDWKSPKDLQDHINTITQIILKLSKIKVSSTTAAPAHTTGTKRPATTTSTPAKPKSTTAKSTTTKPKASTTTKPKASTTQKPKASTTQKAKASTTQKAKASTTQKAKTSTTQKAKTSTTQKAKASTTTKKPTPKGSTTTKRATSTTKRPTSASTKVTTTTKKAATTTSKKPTTAKPKTTTTKKPTKPGTTTKPTKPGITKKPVGSATKKPTTPKPRSTSTTKRTKNSTRPMDVGIEIPTFRIDVDFIINWIKNYGKERLDEALKPEEKSTITRVIDLNWNQYKLPYITSTQDANSLVRSINRIKQKLQRFHPPGPSQDDSNSLSLSWEIRNKLTNIYQLYILFKEHNMLNLVPPRYNSWINKTFDVNANVIKLPQFKNKAEKNSFIQWAEATLNKLTEQQTKLPAKPSPNLVLNGTTVNTITHLFELQITVDENGNIPAEVNLSKEESEVLHSTVNFKNLTMQLPTFRSKQELDRFVKIFESIVAKFNGYYRRHNRQVGSGSSSSESSSSGGGHGGGHGGATQIPGTPSTRDNSVYYHVVQGLNISISCSAARPGGPTVPHVVHYGEASTKKRPNKAIKDSLMSMSDTCHRPRLDEFKELEDSDELLAVVKTKKGGFRGRRVSQRFVEDQVRLINEHVVPMGDEGYEVPLNNSYVFPPGKYYFPYGAVFIGFEPLQKHSPRLI
jgi:hypothetical protein